MTQSRETILARKRRTLSRRVSDSALMVGSDRLPLPDPQAQTRAFQRAGPRYGSAGQLRQGHYMARV